MSTRATTILNSQGDLTIAWDQADDEIMEEVIRRKMASGVVFFIIAPRMGGLMAPEKIAAGSSDDIMARRAFSIRDADIRAFVGGDEASAALPAPQGMRSLPAPEEGVAEPEEAPPIKRGRTARVVKTPDAPAKTTRKTKDPKEAAKNETVGVRQMVGG